MKKQQGNSFLKKSGELHGVKKTRLFHKCAAMRSDFSGRNLGFIILKSYEVEIVVQTRSITANVHKNSIVKPY